MKARVREVRERERGSETKRGRARGRGREIEGASDMNDCEERTTKEKEGKRREREEKASRIVEAQNVWYYADKKLDLMHCEFLLCLPIA